MFRRLMKIKIMQRDSELCPLDPFLPNWNFTFATQDDMSFASYKDCRLITEVNNV